MPTIQGYSTNDWHFETRTPKQLFFLTSEMRTVDGQLRLPSPVGKTGFFAEVDGVATNTAVVFDDVSLDATTNSSRPLNTYVVVFTDESYNLLDIFGEFRIPPLPDPATWETIHLHNHARYRKSLEGYLTDQEIFALLAEFDLAPDAGTAIKGKVLLSTAMTFGDPPTVISTTHPGVPGLPGLAEFKTPEEYGADGTAANDEIAWTALAAAASNGDIIVANGEYNLSDSNINFTSIDNLTVKGTGSITYDRLFNGLQFNTCDNLVVEGLRLISNDSLATWSAYTTLQRQGNPWSGVVVNLCDYFRVSNLTGLEGSVRELVWVVQSNYGVVENCNHKGIFPAITDPSVPIIDAGYHTSITLTDSNHVDLAHCWGEYVGVHIQVASISEYVSVIGGGSNQTHSDGVYYSSGKYGTTTGYSAQASLGTGVKLRGNGSVITGNVAYNCVAGFACSAYENTADAQGANGYGATITNNIAVACGQGVIVRPYTSTTGMRGVVVTDNQIFDSTLTGNEPLSIYACKDVIVSDNIVDGFAATAGGISILQANVLLKNLVMKDNTVRGGANGWLISGVNGGVIADNRLESITSAPFFENCNNIIVRETRTDSSAMQPDFRTTNTLMQIYANEFNAILTENDHATFGNTGGDRAVTITSVTPIVKGQRTINNFQLYEAKGTSGTVDWQRVGIGEPETLIAAGAISVTVNRTHLALAGAGAVTLAAPPVTMQGQVKVIEMTADNGDVTLLTANIEGFGGGTFTFNALNDSLILVGGVSKWVALSPALTTVADLNFSSIAAHTTAELTITVTGAVAGDSVIVTPATAPESGLVWSGYISSANTVTVRLLNGTAGAIDPALITWRAQVVKFA